MFAGGFFVTPHAVRQFQNRIAPWMDYEQALGTIIRELQHAKEFRLTENRKAHYTRIDGRWQFRAIIQEGKDLPAVTTILRSGKGGRRRKNG